MFINKSEMALLLRPWNGVSMNMKYLFHSAQVKSMKQANNHVPDK